MFKLTENNHRVLNKLNEVNTYYLNKLCVDNFKEKDIIEYQNCLANNFIDLLYDAYDFLKFKKSPKKFLANKHNSSKAFNVLITKLCFKIIDLLDLYLKNYKEFYNHALLSHLIIIEIISNLEYPYKKFQ